MAPNRITQLDIVRGFFIFLMILAHSIFFFHTHTHPILVAINAFGDLVSFTGLLFVSAVVAGALAGSAHAFSVKSLGRLGWYFFGYLLISLFASMVIEPLSFDKIIAIITLTHLVPFTEFILAFILFGLIRLLLWPLILKITQNIFPTLIFSCLLYVMGNFLATVDISFIPLGWKALLLGHPGWYSFPILSYVPIYLLGIVYGRHRQATGPSGSKAILIGSVTALIGIVLLSFLSGSFSHLISRWPPSAAFLLIGLISTMLILKAVEATNDLQKVPLARYLLLLLGQKTFNLFFIHTFLIYLFRFLGTPPVYSPLLVVILWLSSLVITLLTSQLLMLSSPLQITIPIGSRRIKPFTIKTLLASVGILLISATPLGLAENRALIEKAVGELQGNLNYAWYVPGFTTDPVIYSLSLPSDLTMIDDVRLVYRIDGANESPMVEITPNNFEAAFTPQNIGQHSIQAWVVLGGNRYPVKESVMNVSSPFYVAWTIDWEGYDARDEYLKAMADISQDFNIPMTHLFNPRIFVNPDISQVRAEYLTDWVRKRHINQQEEIGLHLHMFPDFVESAGVTPHLEPVWGGGFTPGYDILTTAYTYEEMVKILNHAKEWFTKIGLNPPKIYRAGAWFADITTLKALNDTGFLVDSSGRTKYTFGTNKVAGFWDLSATSQPYHPSQTNQNAASPLPLLDILEIPNNGADSYAFTGEAMVERFDANFAGLPLSSPKQVTFLTHPHWFRPNEQARMRHVFSHTNQFRADEGKGPVVYTTLMGIYHAWSQP